MKTTAIILSGGKGLRLGTDIPKQYIEINGRPILSYTLEAFQNSTVDEIIIVAAEEYIDNCFEIAGKIGADKVTAVIPGGSERYYSVLNGLEYLYRKCCLQNTPFCKNDGSISEDTGKTPGYNSAEKPADEQGIVLIHDGARPFIKPDVINRIIKVVRNAGAAIAATPCTDTIKLIDDDGNITGTTKRRLTWAAQTPQAFYLDEIYYAYKTVFSGLSEVNNETREDDAIGNGNSKHSVTPCSQQSITDDAMVYQMVYPDKNIKVVDAGAENIKITTAGDLYIAEKIISRI